MLLDSLAYSASGFVAVGTVAVTAVGRYLEYFREVVAYLFFFHIECSETFDARSVNDISVARNREHF